jgi:hypothetical protein
MKFFRKFLINSLDKRIASKNLEIAIQKMIVQSIKEKQKFLRSEIERFEFALGKI